MENGYVREGSHNVFRCSYDKNGDVSIDKAASGAMGQNVYYLCQLHCIHPPTHFIVVSKGSWHLYVVCLHVCYMMSPLYTILNFSNHYVRHPTSIKFHVQLRCTHGKNAVNSIVTIIYSVVHTVALYTLVDEPKTSTN